MDNTKIMMMERMETLGWRGEGRLALTAASSAARGKKLASEQAEKHDA